MYRGSLSGQVWLTLSTGDYYTYLKNRYLYLQYSSFSLHGTVVSLGIERYFTDNSTTLMAMLMMVSVLPAAVVSMPHPTWMRMVVNVMCSSSIQLLLDLSHVFSSHSEGICGVLIVATSGTECSKPVPFVVSSNAVVDKLEFLTVVGQEDMSLVLVTLLFSVSEVSIARHVFVAPVLLVLSPSTGTLGGELLDFVGRFPVAKMLSTTLLRYHSLVVTLGSTTSGIIHSVLCTESGARLLGCLSKGYQHGGEEEEPQHPSKFNSI